jgi:hypothetical protein
VKGEKMATKEKQPDENYVRMYYEHQYERMKTLEEQRLIFTNIVITLSVVAFTFGFKKLSNLTLLSGIGLPALIMVLNIFAAYYVALTLKYINTHRERAKEVLSKYAKELSVIDSKWVLPKIPLRLGLARIQILIHLIVIALSSIPIVAYFIQ